MKAEEIANKEFPVVMRGYVREEVQAFLAGVAAQIAERDARLVKLEAELADARAARSATPAADSPPAQTQATDRRALLRALGEEAASILACADQSAERMQAQARIDAAKVHADLRNVGSTLVDVHQLLGELVSLVQGLTEGDDPPRAREVTVPDNGETPEFRTVLGQVLGLEDETREIQLPTDSEAGTNPSS